MSAAAGLAAAGIGTPAGRAAADAMRLPAGVGSARGGGTSAGCARSELQRRPASHDFSGTAGRGHDVGTGVLPNARRGCGQPRGSALDSGTADGCGNGYGTVLSLKFPYFDEPIPAPGTLAMAAAQRRLDAVLPVVIGKLDIVAIGNEPFVECQARDRDSTRLNVFCETMARHAIAYRRRWVEAGKGTRLSMGALNHLELPGGGRPRPSGGCSSCAALRRSLVPTSIHTYPTPATAGTTWTTSCRERGPTRRSWRPSSRWPRSSSST